MHAGPYQVIAKYYDGAYAAKQDLVDLPFYVDMAEQSHGPVLEIALVPVTEYGSFAKSPLDNHSEQMIFVLRKA
jgi:hypothetical protein